MNRVTTLSGVKTTLRVVPASRALQMIGLEPGHCAVGLARTSDREPLYRWAGPMASGELVLYGRASETRQVNGPRDLVDSAIVAQRNSQALAWLQSHGLHAQEVSDTATGLRMLRAGRVDFWLVNDLAAQRAIQRLDGDAPRPVHRFGRVDLYVACQRDVASDVMERLQVALAQMRRNGELVEFGLR
jgi:ABC-type amino acid transport substrate-binding protein